MEKLLVQLTPEQIAPIIKHLEEQVQPHLVNDVSRYAVGRRRVWLPYEAPLSNSRPWQLGIDDQKLWQWICYICETHAGFTPDVALVAKGGQIKPHRDTSYADYRAIGINLGPVVWGYQRQRTAYANMPQDDSAEKVEIELQGGEVFEFNSKNIHWTRDADPNRWSINVWQVKGGEQKSKFVAFKKSLAEGPTVSEVPTPKSSDKEENMKAYNIHWTTGPKAGTTESVSVTDFMEVINMVKDSGHAGQIKKAEMDTSKPTTPEVKPSEKGKEEEKVGSKTPFYVMGTGSRSLVLEPKEVREQVKAKLIEEIEKLKAKHPNLVLISGMAEGWDELIARVAVELGLPFIAMVPNKGYGAYYWGKNSLMKKDRMASFDDLLAKAQRVIYTCDSIYVYDVDGKKTHSNFVRNQAMVNMCHGALVYKSESPGTRDAVKRLQAAKKPYKIYPFTNPGGGDDGNKPVIEPSGGGMFQLTYKIGGKERVESFSSLRQAKDRKKEVGNGVIKVDKLQVVTQRGEYVEQAAQNLFEPAPNKENKEQVKTCRALTKNGDLCRRKVTESDYCWQHLDGGEMEVTLDIDEIMARLLAGQPITWMMEPEYPHLTREEMPELWITNDPTPEEILNYRVSFTENMGVKTASGRWTFAVNTGAQRYPFLERLSRHGVKFHIRKLDTKALACHDPEKVKEMTRKHNLSWSDSTSTYLMDIHGVQPSDHLDWSLIGIFAKDVKKLTKRLAEITRLVFTWSYDVKNSEIVRAAPDDQKMAKLVAQMKGMGYSTERIKEGKVQLIDGMNFIRRSAVHKRYRHEHRFMTRVMTDEYLVKGDMIVIDDDIFDQVYGPDKKMVVHPDNVKYEVGFITTGKWAMFKDPSLMTYWVHHPIHDLRYDAQLSINQPHIMGVEFLSRDLGLMMAKLAEDADKGILPNQQYALEPSDLHEVWDNGGMDLAGEAEVARSAVDYWAGNGLDPRALQSMVYFAMNGVVMQLDKSLVQTHREDPKDKLHEKFNIRVSNGFRAACSTREMFEMYFNIQFDTPATKGFYDPRYGMVWPGIRFIQTFRLHGTHDHDDFHVFVPIKIYGEDTLRVKNLKKEGVLPRHINVPKKKEEAIMVLFTMRSPNGAGEYSVMDFDFSTWPEEIPFNEEMVPVVSTDDFLPSLEEMIPNPGNLPGLKDSRKYNKDQSYTRDLFETDLDAQFINPGFGKICNMLLFYSHVTGGQIPSFMPDELGNIVDATQQGADIETFKQIADLSQQFVADFAKMKSPPVADTYVWAMRGQTINKKFITASTSIDKMGFKVNDSPFLMFNNKVYKPAISQLRQDISEKYSFNMRNRNHTVKWVRENVAPKFTNDQIKKMAKDLRTLEDEISYALKADYYGDLPKTKYTHAIASRSKRLALRAVMDKFMEYMLSVKVDGETVPATEETIALRVMLVWVTLLTPRAMGPKSVHGHSDRIMTTANSDGLCLLHYVPAALRHYGYSPDAEVE
jgi:hypothetical protein